VNGALPSLVRRLDALVAAEGLSPQSLTLLGFSQGAILTLGLAAAGHSFGSGLAFSGRLASPIQRAIKGSPKLLISHGTADPVIPLNEGLDAQQRLAAAGFDTQFLPVEGLGHTIASQQIDAARRWLSHTSPVLGAHHAH
jgi:phospholipase/carboxylesterase